MSRSSDGYNVVFRGIGGPNSNFPGVMTWSTFESEEDLQDWLQRSGRQDQIVARGVTSETALALTGQTPVEDQVRAAIDQAESDSTLGRDGLFNAGFVAAEEGRGAEFFAQLQAGECLHGRQLG